MAGSDLHDTQLCSGSDLRNIKFQKQKKNLKSGKTNLIFFLNMIFLLLDINFRSLKVLEIAWVTL